MSRDSGAAEVDCRGGLLTPGFVDAHLHAVQAGLIRTGVDLAGAATREQVLAAVARHVRGRPGVRVVIGHGWDERGWPDSRPPSRAELDRAGAGRPVYLARVDVHSALVSSALLDALPEVSHATGYHPAGLLTQDAHHLCRGQLDELTTDGERRDAARTALASAAELGVVAVHELGGPHLGPLADLARVRQAGEELGLAVTTYWGELASAEAFARMRADGAAGLAGDLCIDGSIGSRTAALTSPYADADSTGARYLSDDDIVGHLVACTRAGVPAGFHCIGDDAVAAAVAGLRRAAAELGADAVRAVRHRLEHLEMLPEREMPTLAALGVVASVQPGFDAAWGPPGELYEARLGPARSRGMNAFGSLQRSGVTLAFGTDAPVTPLAGWRLVRDAVRHSRPEQRLAVPDAFAAATVGGWRAAGDDRAGRLEVAAPAHLVVWDTTDFPDLELDALPWLAADEDPPRCWFRVAARTGSAGAEG